MTVVQSSHRPRPRTISLAAAQVQRFTELDGLRGLAALGVVIYHFGMGVQRVWRPVFEPLYDRGLFLVDLFFALSGFVLCHAFGTSTRRHRLFDNLKSRVLRLYPLHLVTLLLVAALWFAFVDILAPDNAFHSQNDGWHFLLNLLLLQNSGLEQSFSYNTPSWSISAEFLVNVLFFLVLLLPQRIATWIMALATLASAVQLQRHGLVTVSRWYGIDLSLLRTIMGFFAGVFAYRLYMRSLSIAIKPWHADFIAAALLLCTIGFFSRWGVFAHHTRTLMVVWALLVFPLGLVVVLRSGLARRCLLARPMHWLGKVSFSLYLIHLPVLYAWVVVMALIGASPLLASGPGLLLFAVSSLLAATVTFRYIEGPTHAWTRRHFGADHAGARGGSRRLRLRRWGLRQRRAVAAARRSPKD